MHVLITVWRPGYIMLLCTLPRNEHCQWQQHHSARPRHKKKRGTSESQVIIIKIKGNVSWQQMYPAQLPSECERCSNSNPPPKPTKGTAKISKWKIWCENTFSIKLKLMISFIHFLGSLGWFLHFCTPCHNHGNAIPVHVDGKCARTTHHAAKAVSVGTKFHNFIF